MVKEKGAIESRFQTLLKERYNLSNTPVTGVASNGRGNGHTNAATPPAGDIRPQPHHRIDTPTLRGVNIQPLLGSQRALKINKDFTEFEQRAAYFDGDRTQ